MGILVAANGITGDPIERSRAYSVLERALSDHQEILVVTRDEIESLTDTTELVYLLKQKRAQLAVSGTIFLSTGE
jgi:MinD-like ATPase involved in chromosome partitioning or flagellar assembly